jgi:hypothetical protein
MSDRSPMLPVGMTVFEVDRTCVGASPERDEHGVATGRLLRPVADLHGLLRFASRFARVRILPPATGRGPYQLELTGADEGGLAIQASTTFQAIGVEIPGSDWERLGAGIERRHVVVRRSRRCSRSRTTAATSTSSTSPARGIRSA